MAPNPLITIWTSPRETLRTIVPQNPELYVDGVICLAGVGYALDAFSDAGDKPLTWTNIVLACVFGPILGLINLWISSHLLRWTGTWIGGTGNVQHLRTAIGWAAVPSAFALLLWIPKLLLLGAEGFSRLDAQPLLWIPVVLIALADVVLFSWGFVLLCHTVAEVQGFRSAWTGLGNVVLSAVVVVVPLVLMGYGLWWLAGGM